MTAVETPCLSRGSIFHTRMSSPLLVYSKPLHQLKRVVYVGYHVGGGDGRPFRFA
jgi:hypothetical protein